MEDNLEDKEKNKDSGMSVKEANGSLHSRVNVQTYTKDLTNAIESNQGKIIKNMIQGQEGYGGSDKIYSHKSGINKIFVIIGIVLLVLAIGVIVVVWLLNNHSNTMAVTPQPQSLIFTDQTESDEIKDLNKDEIEKTILAISKNSTVKIGGIEGIYPTINKKDIGLREFMNLTEGNLDFKKYTSISDHFLMGVMRYLPIENSNLNDIVAPTPSLLIPESKQITLNSSVFFKTGTTEFVDIEAKDKAEKAIHDFLDGIDFSTTQINVVGSYSIERPSSKNADLAEARKKLGLDILNEVLNQKYSSEDISKINITVEAKGISIHDLYTKDEINAMTKPELNNAIDSTQGIEYFVQAKTKSNSKPNLASTTGTNTSIDNTTGTNAPMNTSTDVYPSNVSNSETKVNINSKSKIGFFILIQTKSFSETLPVMQEWESEMFSDLHGLFDIEINPDNQYLTTKSFEDGIIQNKNARILRDNNGNIVLMYIFVNHESVVIADSNEVVKELISRLFSAQLKH